MTLVAGIDSSTQSCKVVIHDSTTGEVIRFGSAPHPDGSEIDPRHWWSALLDAVTAAGGLADVAAVSIAGQQQGLVLLDQDGEVIRPALLWHDTRAAPAAHALVTDFGDGSADAGRKRWATEIGAVPTTSFTIAKLRWLSDHEPDTLARIAAIALPHDWLTWQLRGGPKLGLDALCTDRSEASGTGYYDSLTGQYRTDLLELAIRRPADHLILPRIATPNERIGFGRSDLRLSHAVLAAGMADNAASAHGFDLEIGELLVSLGTSGVISTRSRTRSADTEGIVAGFADARDDFLLLTGTINGARTLDAACGLLGASHDEFSQLALAAQPGADGLVLVPFLEGERVPDLPSAAAIIDGLTLRSFTRENFARATVEGLLCHVASAGAALEAYESAHTVTLIGGASRSAAVATLAPGIFNTPVRVAAPGEYVARGAARQAAWALSGAAEPPCWPASPTELVTGRPQPRVLEEFQRVVQQHYYAGPGQD